MWMDSWGNEFKKKKQAIANIHRICREREDFWEMVGEYMNIDSDVMDWITSDDEILESFKINFEEQIQNAENDWCEWYIDDIEKI